MTTKLTRPVARALFTDRGTELVVTLAREGIVLREKGRRTRFVLPYGRAYLEAVRIHVAAERAAKIAARRARRAA